MGGAVIYAGVFFAGHALYKRLLYPSAGRKDTVPDDAKLLECTASDGVAVHGFEFGSESAARTIVYFHGNGEVVGDNASMARHLARRGFHVVLAEYRGYGLSAPGKPDEVGLYADAEAILAALAERGVDASRVVLWGRSLGTGIAVEMARRGRGSALVLVAPYTSILDAASRFVPFLPMRLLMNERFDNLSKAPALRLPTLIIHGTRDEVVPFRMGQQVAEAITGAKLVAVEGRHHNDLFLGPGVRYLDEAADFIESSRVKTP
jgi:fermentation-respiration switch protein FrsA (DUF1100 family)